MAERKRKTRGRSSSNSANYLIDLCPISRLYYRLLGKLLSSRQIKMLITRILSFHSNHAFFVHNFVGPRSRKGWILMQRQDSFKLASLFIFFFSSSRFLWRLMQHAKKRTFAFLKIYPISYHSFILCKKFLLEILFFFVDFYFLGEFITLYSTFLILYI